MPIGIERLNPKEAHPNDNIIFISALKHEPDHDKALEIMKAVAAQFKPIMKNRHYGVMSLTEYSHNREFAGRNWNAGEIIELVLRRADHSFAPYLFVLSVMCHELAHIEQMNHSAEFRRVNLEIKNEMYALRRKGYFGDGFWPQGTRLNMGRADRPFRDEERPQVACGGANYTRGAKKKRRVGQTFQHGRSLDEPPPGKKLAKPRAAAAKPGRTGRQTAVPRAAGSRVQSKSAFKGTGQTLSADPSESTFRKQANSNSAVQARLAAAEARARAAKIEAGKRSPPVASTSRLAPSPAKSPSLGAIDLVSDEDEDELEDDDDDDTPAPRAWGANFTGLGTRPDEDQKPVVKEEDEEDAKPFTEDELRYLRDEMDDWEDDYLIVQGGAGSATVPGGKRGGQGGKDEAKGKEVEVVTLDDSDEEEEGVHEHGEGGLCCGYDFATAWAEFEADVEAGLWGGC